MITPESTVSKAKEAAIWLDETIQSEFGAAIYIPKLPEPIKATTNDVDFRLNKDFVSGPLLPIGANIDYLPGQVGKGFLISLFRPGLKDKLYPGVVSASTASREIHFSYLDSPINRSDVFKGLDPIEELVLRGSSIMQDRRIGSVETHEEEEIVHIATEIGHLAMAVRSLSSPSVIENSIEHKVHAWSAGRGIVPAMTNSAPPQTPGAFDLPDRTGPLVVKFEAIKRERADCTFVYSEEFKGALRPKYNPPKSMGSSKGRPAGNKEKNRIPTRGYDGVNPAVVLLGLGVVAARGRLGTKKADAQLLRALHSL